MGLRPWRTDIFKVSGDPDFEAKLDDVVGLYLDPPERAAVFSFDQGTQTQALGSRLSVLSGGGCQQRGSVGP
ncbi:hypothetical protein [Candidatus Poriferisodalis sp.]|uniref:hypothetical protein n=1 Tax=Candidatus Poriferisodalis sp. TaxID=3101277 RepID=UPI003B012402